MKGQCKIKGPVTTTKNGAKSKTLRVEKNRNIGIIKRVTLVVNTYFEKIIDFGFEYVPN
jgi:hypothetical protein